MGIDINQFVVVGVDLYNLALTGGGIEDIEFSSNRFGSYSLRYGP